MRRFAKLQFFFFLLLFSLFTIFACKQAVLYEKLENIPGATWKAEYKPSFIFNISDTVSLYDVFITIRHTNSYAYNNLWIESSLQLPGDSLINRKLDLQLANSDGWMGTGMDDIYERRIKVNAVPQRFKKGQASFILQQAMRQNPLPGIMQVGVRLEKLALSPVKSGG